MDTLHPRIGLLPLYVALYDRAQPDNRGVIADTVADVAGRLEEAGLGVTKAPVCCRAKEFDAALTRLEEADVDALVTLHLAYSPSGESVPRLCKSPLPILILDTTPDPAFTPETPPERLMQNHGIHGVQDMASLLRRNGRRFAIEAGHLERSDVLQRIAARARAAAAARSLRERPVARIGDPFEGMDDFAVDDALLRRRFGISVVSKSVADVAQHLPDSGAAAVDQELERDRERFECSDVDPDLHRTSVRAGLALRALAEAESLGGLTMNFLSFTQQAPMPTVPFLEAAKGMAHGIGYSGENDVLTAAFAGALLRAYGEGTFTEMFCPDWENGNIFLSHMGEMNPAVAERRPRLVAADFPWAEIVPPAIAACAPRPGPAVFVNIVPGPAETFSLVLAPVEVLPEPETTRFADKIRGWMRPAAPLERFLEAYSRHGGTHHAILVFGNRLDDLRYFADVLDLETVVIA
jgi:L-arabinose isomerase